jgi:hypothetical protein
MSDGEGVDFAKARARGPGGAVYRAIRRELIILRGWGGQVISSGEQMQEGF